MTGTPRRRSIRTERLARFLSDIETLPLDAWRQMAYACPARIAGGRIAELRRALDAAAGAFETQCAKDGVAVALRRFESAEGRPLVRRPGTISRIQRATENAALAVLARDGLELETFRALVSGFGPLC
jgi:hypothetical protein